MSALFHEPIHTGGAVAVLIVALAPDRGIIIAETYRESKGYVLYYDCVTVSGKRGHSAQNLKFN